MPAFSRMPRYDIRNDGVGPYGVFYCDTCNREFRSQPDVANTLTSDIGRQALGGCWQGAAGSSAVANNVTGDDPRYSYKMTPLSSVGLEAGTGALPRCPTCKRIVCLSDFDTQSGFCQEDSPRTSEIAEARGAQTGAAIKGFAAAFGLGDVMKQAGQRLTRPNGPAPSWRAAPMTAPLLPRGTKFCPECGTPMIQPSVEKCPKCGTETHGANSARTAATKWKRRTGGCMTNCGAQTGGAKFCPECGTKQA